MSKQTSFNLSVNSTKQEMDSVTWDKTVLESPSPQSYSPISLSNHKVFNTTSCTKQHSKGLLTPCRQVGLRRKSFRNVVSPLNSDNIVTPKNLRFVSPVGNCKGHKKFMGSVLDKHILHEEETHESMGKRLNLENMNEKAKQCKYEVKEEPFHDEHEERTTEKIQTENFDNKGLQGDMDVHSCKDSDLQSNSDNEHNNISSEGSRNGETAIEKNLMENKNDVTHHFNADTHSCKYLDFQSNSSNKDNMNSFDSMIECTEDNLNILKRQVTVKEEEVERLKLTLLYKKKVIHVD
jgi:hypothetical protein